MRSQLDELRTMASKGRDQSVGGGAFLVIWGIAVAIGSSLELVLSPTWPSIVPWGAAVASGLIASLAQAVLLRRSMYGSTWRTEVLMSTWLASGAAIALFNLGEDLAHAGLTSESEAMTAMIIGAAVATTGAVTHSRVLIAPTIGWLVTGLCLIAFKQTAGLSILLCGAALLLLVLPGSILLLRSPRAHASRSQ